MLSVKCHGSGYWYEGDYQGDTFKDPGTNVRPAKGSMLANTYSWDLAII